MSAWSFDGCVCKLNAAIKNGGFNRIVWIFVLIPVSTAYMGYLRIGNSKPDDISGSQNRIRKWFQLMSNVHQMKISFEL